MASSRRLSIERLALALLWEVAKGTRRLSSPSDSVAIQRQDRWLQRCRP